MLCVMVGCGRTEPVQPFSVGYLEGKNCEASPMLNIDFQGVWSAPNQHSKVPLGAALVAQNIVSDSRGIAACVTGQRLLSEALAPASELSSAVVYQGHIVEHYASGKLARRNFTSPALTAYTGTYTPATGVRMRFEEAGGDLYLTTQDGLQRLDGVGETPELAEVPEGLSMLMVTSPGTLFSEAGQSVAYRYLISRPDSEGTYRRGAPSGRFIYTALGTEDITVRVMLPEGLSVTDRVEVYRTSISPPGVDPGDVMFLATQFQADGSNYQEFVDATPDVLLGETLYTSASQQGISRANERPPVSNELVLFNDRLLLGNVRGPHRFIFRLLATPSNNDQITIAGVTYTAKIAPSTNEEFQLYTAGTVAQNIEITARNLINKINTWDGLSAGTRTVYARSLSGSGDPPGIILVEERDPAGSGFTAQASTNGTRYEPALTTAQSSYAEEGINEVWSSKAGLHWAYPRDSRFKMRLGSGTRPLTRLVKLRTSAYAFIQQEGIWRITYAGDERWRVEQVSNTAHLLVQDSVAVVDDRIFALTTRGLVAVDESGVQEVGVQIRDKFDAIAKLPAATVQAETFAVADDARQRYILYHPLTAASDTSDHAWVYNGATDVWTERTDEATGGLVNGDNGLLYLGLPTGEVTEERYGEDVDVYKNPDNSAIEFRLVWTVLDEGNPGSQKRFTEMKLLTRNAFSGNVVFDCTNDLGGEESVTGVAENTPYCLVWVPDGVQRTSRLLADIQREVLGESFEVVGMDVKAKTYGGRLTRN
jgi:hypothetical protein